MMIMSMSRLDAIQLATGLQFEVKVIVIDAVKRSIRKLRVKRDVCELERLLLQGDSQIQLPCYRQLRLENGDDLFYLLSGVPLEPQNRQYFTIGNAEPCVWRAVVMADGDVASNLRETKAVVKFIDATTARLVDEALTRAELLAGALTGEHVERWRPWEE
jgi:hypothetical protein